jgi:hypothetical protein
MKFEGISFNSKWAASKTEAEFLEHEKHHDLTEAQLKKAYSLCVEAEAPPAEEKKSAKAAK